MKPAPGLLDHPFGADYATRIGVAADKGLAAIREQARAVFESRGLPGPKNESWRFTPLRGLTKIAFIPAAAADDVDVGAVPADVPTLPGAARIVLVNGVYRRDLSDKIEGVEISDLRGVFASADRNLLGHLATAAFAPLAALNASYMTDALSLRVANSTTTTVHLISIAAAGSQPLAFHPRVLISLAAGASLTLVETHCGLPGQPTFSNPVTEISLGEGAALRRYVQVAEQSDSFHLATAAVALAAGSRLEGFHLGLGGALVRQEVNVVMRGTGAVLDLNGAYALDGHSHHDFTTSVDHHVPGCISNQVFKGVVDGDSHGVYQGRIHVARDAQKTDARQLHKALFLGRGPRIDCKPELEIYADDVQCAHGAATGEIDADHLFYMAARGIDPATARALLVEAFLADAVERISDEAVRGYFGHDIQGWLARRNLKAGA
ncbi:MAG: Fe-S cluster assembly protein SufD [Rhodospirillaceae bacterium]